MAFVMHFDATGNADFACSGTLISSNVVLTAGHCTVDETTGATLDASGYRVVTGAVDWTDASKRRISHVLRVIPNPSYDPAATTGDAGLLVLSAPPNLPALRLATRSDQTLLRPGTPADIAGWGQLDSNSSVEQHLQWASTAIQSADYCGAIPLFDPSAELCATDYPAYATGGCSGDSGGPLLAVDIRNQPVELGVTSRGPSDCATDVPDVYTRVDRLSAWAARWTATVEPRLPTMASPDARRYVRATVVGVYGANFRNGRNYIVRCARNSAQRFKCQVSWRYGSADYFGAVSVYYVRDSHSVVVWTDQYVVHSVDDHCYFHANHRSRCNVGTKRGSW
jgi:secreted trypsin-like serine protease